MFSPFVQQKPHPAPSIRLSRHHSGELAFPVERRLEAMAGQLDLLSEMLNQIVPMDVLVNAFGTFGRLAWPVHIRWKVRGPPIHCQELLHQGSFSRYVDPPVS